MPWRTAAAGLAEGLDRLFHAAVLNGPASHPRRSPDDPVERTHALEAMVRRVAPLAADPGLAFPAPPLPEVTERRVRRQHGAAVIDLRFLSPHRVWIDEVRPRWRRYPQNRTVHARAWRRDDARPAVVILHGYLGGHFPLTERVWPLRWLLRQGVDPVLVALPFHGTRRRPDRAVPPFPAADPLFTVEGFRQAVADVRALARWLRERGAPAVGLMGMSLGGYTSALAATTPGFDFVVPFIPLASLADFAERGGRLVGTPTQRREQHALLEAAYSVVSPLARPVQAPRGARLVVAGRRDRVTPLEHARRLAQHLDAPLVTFDGGHLLQVGRAEGFRALGRLFADLGFERSAA